MVAGSAVRLEDEMLALCGNAAGSNWLVTKREVSIR